MVCGMTLGFKAVCIYRDYEQNQNQNRLLMKRQTDNTTVMMKVWFGYALMNQYFSHVIIKPQLFVVS